MGILGNLLGNGCSNNCEAMNVGNHFAALQSGLTRTEAQSAFNTELIGWQNASLDTKLAALNANITAQIGNAVQSATIGALTRELAEKSNQLQTAQIIAGVGGVVAGAVQNVNCNTNQAVAGGTAGIMSKIDCCCDALKATLSGNDYVKAATLTVPTTTT